MLQSTLNCRSVAPLRNLISHAQPNNSPSTGRQNASLTASRRRSANYYVFNIGLGAAESLGCFELGLKSSLGSLASALRSTEVGRIAFHSAGLPGARLGGAGLCEIGFGDAGLAGLEDAELGGAG